MTSRHFPVHIIEKILLKLPAKSIIRFRCVCKTWRDLSKSYRFALLHIAETEYHCLVRILFNRNCRREELGNSQYHQMCDSELVVTSNTLSWKELLNPENPQITFSHEMGSTCVDRRFKHVLEELPGRMYCPRFHLAGNCNGILCVSDYVRFFLINTSLREVKEIPAPPLKFGEEYCHLIGLGFDNLTRDFKVVTIVNSLSLDTPNRQTALVYNLSVNYWTALGEIPIKVFVQKSPPTFFNGVIHWFVCTTNPTYRMLAFNSTTNLFQQMNLPENITMPTESSHLLLNQMQPRPSLLVLNENLLAFVSVQSAIHKDQLVNIWVMKEYGVEESWTKLYSISTPSYIREPVSFWKEDTLLVKTMDGRLVLFDLLQGRESASIDFRRNPNSGYLGSHGFPLGLRVCKGSLISLSSV